MELLDREKRASERRLKLARFPNLKSPGDFDFAAQPSLNRVLVAELLWCEFVERRESVIFLGHPGTGKTHLATALGIAARPGPASHRRRTHERNTPEMKIRGTASRARRNS